MYKLSYFGDWPGKHSNSYTIRVECCGRLRCFFSIVSHVAIFAWVISILWFLQNIFDHGWDIHPLNKCQSKVLHFRLRQMIIVFCQLKNNTRIIMQVFLAKKQTDFFILLIFFILKFVS